MTENIPQMIWVADQEANFRYLSPKWLDYTGTTEAENANGGWIGAIHPDDRPRALRTWQDSVQTLTAYEAEYRLRDRTGHYRWHLTRAVPMPEARSATMLWFGTTTDIEDQKRAEEALRESEQRFRSLSESVPQLVWTADSQGNTNYVNERWCEYTGLNPQQSMGMGGMQALHPDDMEKVRKAWRRTLASGEPLQVEFRLRGREGQYRWFMSRAIPVRDDSGQIKQWFGSCTDIHDLKGAHDALMRTEKLASVGRLAASIAHEINNPLESTIHWKRSPICST
jgi:PAS domain S-box-containing protein